jgi:hypothetical protein
VSADRAEVTLVGWRCRCTPLEADRAGLAHGSSILWCSWLPSALVRYPAPARRTRASLAGHRARACASAHRKAGGKQPISLPGSRLSRCSRPRPSRTGTGDLRSRRPFQAADFNRLTCESIYYGGVAPRNPRAEPGRRLGLPAHDGPPSQRRGQPLRIGRGEGSHRTGSIRARTIVRLAWVSGMNANRHSVLACKVVRIRAPCRCADHHWAAAGPVGFRHGVSRCRPAAPVGPAL